MRTSTESILIKICGTAGQYIQLDESYFAGRGKYNRGKLRSGDDRLYGDEQARHEMEMEVLEAGSEESDDLGPPTWPSSYGIIVIGPWVVGLYMNKREFRFFVVPDRKSSTLRAISRRFRAHRSISQTDEWGVNVRLRDNGFVRNTFNHSRWFVNPRTGVHTQSIYRLWIGAISIMKRH